MNIRQVHKDEWSNLQVLNNEVFVDNAQYDQDLIEDWAFSKSGKNYFQELVNDSKRVCFVAENDSGRLVGYLAASPKSFGYRKSKYLEVDNMGVMSEYRSQGIGAKLMTECKNWARKNGYQKLYVNSYFRNKRAIAFYKNCGFGEIDTSLEMVIG